MGCDIHVYIEVKINGKWHLYNQLDLSRNYHIFGYLAGVRSEEKPHYDVKGLPYDISIMVGYENKRWGSDGHTHSWLNQTELTEFVDYYEEHYKDSDYHRRYAMGYLYGNTYNLKEYPEDYPEWVQDVRMVFWFDN